MAALHLPYKLQAPAGAAVAHLPNRRPQLYTTFLFICFCLCLCFTSYLLGAWHHRGDAIVAFVSNSAATNNIFLPTKPDVDGSDSSTAGNTTSTAAAALDLIGENKSTVVKLKLHYPPCDVRYSEHTPCHEMKRFRRRGQRIDYERHCTKKRDQVKCRVPAPYGYRIPFKWPASRDIAWYANVPHKHLAVAKAVQNWVRHDGDYFRFPGGGTMFRHGADAYIDEIGNLINLKDGSIRTALDTGCGVASWGAYLVSRNIMTMSFAPNDSHEAQVQFALERGVPALIGVLATKRLPYPSRAFDMAHCSRCLIRWAQHDGQYLIEVDRVLRPGGYWVLSGPPINWGTHWRGWNRTRSYLNNEQKAIEKVAQRLCWKKMVEKDEIAIWQKPTNHIHCKQTKRRIIPLPPFCLPQDPDNAWYTNMDSCLTPLPEVGDIREVAGGKVAKWPERLNTVPPRISQGTIDGLTPEKFKNDVELWKRRVSYYKSFKTQLGQAGRFRNLLDMNAYVGGFAAALIQDPVWVMNVVPVEARVDTLGVIYERGLIGTYQSWCEAMSTYPRTYDLIHADSIFSLYINRCEMEDIILEVDRILRPEGIVIVRDEADVLITVKNIIDGMDYDSQIIDHEDGPLVTEKLLFAAKSYWTSPKPN